MGIIRIRVSQDERKRRWWLGQAVIVEVEVGVGVGVMDTVDEQTYVYRLSDTYGRRRGELGLIR